MKTLEIGTKINWITETTSGKCFCSGVVLDDCNDYVKVIVRKTELQGRIMSCYLKTEIKKENIL